MRALASKAQIKTAIAARNAFNAIMRVTQWADEPDILPNGMKLLRPWEELPPHIRRAWLAVVIAIREESSNDSHVNECLMIATEAIRRGTGGPDDTLLSLGMRLADYALAEIHDDNMAALQSTFPHVKNASGTEGNSK